MSTDNDVRELYNDPSVGLTGMRTFVRNTGIPKEVVERALLGSLPYTLNRTAVRRFPRMKTFASGVDTQWQADLADMQAQRDANDGYRYILTVIDVFSRYLWCIPLKSKSMESVAEGFEELFKKVKPLKLQTDQGTEFFNKKMTALMKKYDVKHFHTFSEVKCSIAERVIRTLRMRLTRLWDARGTFKYIDALPEIVKLYNATKHSTLKMSPDEARLPANKDQVLINLYGTLMPKPATVPLKPGTTVRLSMLRGVFTKEQVEPWSKEMYYVKAVNKTNPVTYTIADHNHEVLKGHFYRQELQPVEAVTAGVNVLDERVHRGKKQYLVEWVGYDELEPEWIDESQLA